ncbi:MAG: hypothetical protein J0L56_15535 [Chitinophagales bacterium]|nr:hypothetical protein [Chitinophagales bacterium]
MIRIEYSKKNQYLSVHFFKKVFDFKPTTQDGIHSTSLEILIYEKKKRRIYTPEDYHAYMPYNIGFDKSIEALAKMLTEYGSDVLKGKKWQGSEE